MNQTREQLIALGAVFEAAALVDRIAKAETPGQAVEDVLGLCRELAEGVRAAR